MLKAKQTYFCPSSVYYFPIGTFWFQIGKGVCQGCILSPCLLNLYAEYIMRSAGLKKHKLESRLPGEISITSDMQMTPPLWQKVKRNSKASWWKWKRRVKSWLKAQHSENKDHGIWSHHFMANRWGNSGKVSDFIFLGSKITAAMKLKDTYSLEGKLWPT